MEVKFLNEESRKIYESEMGLNLKGIEVRNGLNLGAEKTRVGDVFDLKPEEIKIIKSKHKLIKLLTAGIAGIGGMNFVAHIGVDQAVKGFIAFLGDYSTSFLRILPVPNYFIAVLALYVLTEVYVGIKEALDMKK